MHDDRHWMTQALALARTAAALGEVPVGAILVRDDQQLGAGSNRPITSQDPTAHAEIIALREAARNIGNYRLPGSTLYVTIEPCTMCFGAMIHARVARLVYGAPEPRAGVCRSNLQLPDQPLYNHRVEVVGGVLEEECAAVIRAFFRGKR